MKKINRTGEKHTTNEGYTIEIIECFGCEDCTVKFENGVIIKNKSYGGILKRKVKNPYHKSVYGIGYFGVGNYSGVTHPKIYQTWNGMLTRCYDKKYQEKNSTYKDCSVDEDWHNFQNFGKWFEENYKENQHLDKDILFKGNKVYNQKTCAFVPSEINSLLVKRDASRGKYPIGVCKFGKKFQACIRIKSKTTHLGTFDTPQEAFQVYKTVKEAHIKDVAKKHKREITEPTYQALINYQVEITD